MQRQRRCEAIRLCLLACECVQLLKNTQALKNFSIQMKILASVQAAGGTTKTEDNQVCI